jgi:glyoxylase-like metal-dependent hydrolase (beta-lactamase superfamily II)
MIDALWPDSLNSFYKTIGKHNIKIESIKYVIVTHFHPDHAGLVQTLKNKGITVLLHECQKDGIHWLNDFFIRHPEKEYEPIAIDGMNIISSEESKNILKEIGMEGEIIATNGHSEDSISIIIEENIFTGDLPDLEYIEGYHSEKLTENWERILKYKIKKAFPAHTNAYDVKSKLGLGYGRIV